MNRKIAVSTIAVVLVIVILIAAYFLVSKPATATMVSVEPGSITQAVSQDFTVNISVSNVNDLYGWELKFTWNSSILSLVRVTEGGFLKSQGQTFFTYNNTASYVLVDCTLLGNVSGITGEGILASIQMHVNGQGSCNLVLYDVKLINSIEQTIDNTLNSGHFSTPS